jgi:hypothetical protein
LVLVVLVLLLVLPMLLHQVEVIPCLVALLPQVVEVEHKATLAVQLLMVLQVAQDLVLGEMELLAQAILPQHRLHRVTTVGQAVYFHSLNLVVVVAHLPLVVMESLLILKAEQVVQVLHQALQEHP